jgi:hypothetical protein
MLDSILPRIHEKSVFSVGAYPESAQKSPTARMIEGKGRTHRGSESYLQLFMSGGSWTQRPLYHHDSAQAGCKVYNSDWPVIFVTAPCPRGSCTFKTRSGLLGIRMQNV